MKRRKKILSLMLAALMVASLLPSAAFATAMSLDDLKQAIAATEAGGTVTLTGDVVIPAGPENNIALDKKITIDGDGHTIIRSFNTTPGNPDPSYGDYEAVFVIGSAGVTVKNVKIFGLDAGMKDETAIWIDAVGTATDKIVVEGCEFVGAANVAAASGGSGIIGDYGSSDYLEVKGNTFTNLKHGVWFNEIGNATIDGNTFNGVKYTGIHIVGGSANVTVTNNTLTDVASANYANDEFASGIWIGANSTGITLCDNTVALNSGATNGKKITVVGNTVENSCCTLFHTLMKTAAKAATYTATGNNEYYTCSVCNKVFKEISCTTETTVEAETLPKLTLPSSGGTGGGSTKEYKVKIADGIINGKVTVSPIAACAGETVTVTLTPNTGFRSGTVTVTDKNKKKLSVKDLGNDKYSFVMPESTVTVSATFVASGTAINPFVDVAETAYYYGAVMWAAANGITQGVNPTHFAPAAGVTRAQVVTFLWRAAGSPVAETVTASMTDVAWNAYYAEAVRWALENEVTKGMTKTTFAPNEVCTRAQIVTLIARYSGVEDAVTESGFKDVKSTDYFAAAVAWATKNGVTQGMTETTFAPQERCTRGQTVTFLYRNPTK